MNYIIFETEYYIEGFNLHEIMQNFSNQQRTEFESVFVLLFVSLYYLIMCSLVNITNKF